MSCLLVGGGRASDAGCLNCDVMGTTATTAHRYGLHQKAVSERPAAYRQPQETSDH